MTVEQQLLLDLIRTSITGKCVFTKILASVDWGELYKLASKQGCVGICVNAIDVMRKYDMDICPIETKLQLFVRSQQVEKAAKWYREKVTEFTVAVRPLKLVVLKGIDYSEFWPNPMWREFGDLDCCVIGEDSYALDKKCKELGYDVKDDDYKHTEIHTDSIIVENHHFFTRCGGTKEGLLLERELQKLFMKSRSDLGEQTQTLSNTFKQLGATGLYSPNKEFTAIFMLEHALNHFFNEGITLRIILDWYFFLIKEGRNVEWESVNRIMSRTRLKMFGAIMTGFCVKYFGLKANGMEYVDGKLLDKFTKDIFVNQRKTFNRRWYMMFVKMCHRYRRLIRFRKLNKSSVGAAMWRMVAFSSVLHRTPKLKTIGNAYIK